MKNVYEHPFITAVNCIVDKNKKGEFVSTKKNSKGFCLIFIVNLSDAKVIDVIDTDIFWGQLMRDSNYNDTVEISRNLKLKGYSLSHNDTNQTELVGVLMLYSDYCNALTAAEQQSLGEGNLEMYNSLFPRRDDYITDHIYPTELQIKSELIEKRAFTSFDYENFLWSSFEI